MGMPMPMKFVGMLRVVGMCSMAMEAMTFSMGILALIVRLVG
jgi:hypothetical protein